MLACMVIGVTKWTLDLVGAYVTPRQIAKIRFVGSAYLFCLTVEMHFLTVMYGVLLRPNGAISIIHDEKREQQHSAATGSHHYLLCT